MNAPLRKSDITPVPFDPTTSKPVTQTPIRAAPGGRAAGTGAQSPMSADGQPAARSEAAKAGGAAASQLEQLLVHESEVREAETAQALKYLIVNHSKQLFSAQQVVFRSPANPRGGTRIEMVSSVAQIDANAPVVRWLEKVLQKTPDRSDAKRSGTFTVHQIDSNSAPGGAYPFTHVLSLSLTNRGRETIGHVDFLSDKPFGEMALALGERLTVTYAHALAAFGRQKSRFGFLLQRKVMWTATMLAAIAMFIPVPMMVLAPVEVIAKDPFVVASPLSGVIETVHVKPNTPVKKGDRLFSYVKTDLQGQFDVAARTVEVVNARRNRSAQESFGVGAGRRDLAVTQAELDMAMTELKHARANLAKTDVHAERDGIVLFSSVEEWTGRPVATGERVMRLADPSRTQFRIDLAVGDALALSDETTTLVFLDTDPLDPITAKISRHAYQAAKTDRDVLAFKILAEEVEPENSRKEVRIGLQGMAQLRGDDVPLGFFLFRKPISTIRQFLGL